MIDKRCMALLKYLYRKRVGSLIPGQNKMFFTVTEEMLNELQKLNYIVPVGHDNVYRLTVAGRGCVEAEERQAFLVFLLSAIAILITIRMMMLTI